MATQKFKTKKIKAAIKANNISELRHKAIKHGFINNTLRKQAWPMLLGMKNNINNTNNSNIQHKSFSYPSNKSNHEQIEKDIARSALNFYNLSEEKKQESITNIGHILHSIFESEQMHYIQGFNDIVSVIYVVCDSNLQLSKSISNCVAKTLLADFTMNDSSQLNFKSLQLIFKLISYYDNKLHQLFESIEQIYLLPFCVSWILTLFAHQIQDINIIARIYDYCLSHNNKHISLYLATALFIYFRKQLLKKVHDDASLHCFFQQIQWEKINFNKVINISEELFHKYPPNIVSSYSVYCNINMDEIKEEMSDNTSDNESEYNSDTSKCENIFDIDINDKKSIKKSNIIFINSIQSIPYTITSFVGQTVSLFDKKKKTVAVVQ